MGSACQGAHALGLGGCMASDSGATCLQVIFINVLRTCCAKGGHFGITQLAKQSLTVCHYCCSFKVPVL